jgi:hypothetical protein
MPAEESAGAGGAIVIVASQRADASRRGPREAAAADRRVVECPTRTECPRICWHTIAICGNRQRYGKPLKQRGFLSRSGEHSSRYRCQQDSIFLHSPMSFKPFPHCDLLDVDLQIDELR